MKRSLLKYFNVCFVLLFMFSCSGKNHLEKQKLLRDSKSNSFEFIVPNAYVVDLAIGIPDAAKTPISGTITLTFANGVTQKISFDSKANIIGNWLKSDSSDTVILTRPTQNSRIMIETMAPPGTRCIIRGFEQIDLPENTSIWLFYVPR